MDIRRRFLSKKSSGGSSGGDSSGTYTVNLNSQWEKTTAVTNPDSSLYDGVYRSTSNYHVNSGVATMYITLTGCSTFKLYIRSYAESDYDYVMVSQLDKTITGSSSYSDTTLVKAHTRGKQQSGTALSSYTPVEFTGIDGGSHRITVMYRKDGSANSGDDRGYVLIPKSQGSGGESGGGDVDIDTTYSIMYTSSDGNVVTPYKTDVFGANITSNTYVNGQGIITFDGPVTSIGNNAFRNCDGLTSITIPNRVSLIGDYAFYSCEGLTSITVPNSVTSIGNRAFGGCSKLKEFKGKFASSDGRCLIVDGVLNSFVPSGLTTYIIPNSVTSIGRHAFYNCTSLTSITIPDSVTSIENNAFYNCSGLTSITIPNSVTKIGVEAFAWCDGLTSITIPNCVTSIGNQAFYYCRGLTSVYCKATTPPTLGGSSVFDKNSSSRKIYVPTASVDAYKSASGWSKYADYIVGYDFEDDGGSSELITFTVGGTEYQAEEGMTWEEFINSEYNDGNFTSSNNRVKYNGYNIYCPRVTGSSIYTLTRSTLSENDSYIIYRGTGGAD